MNIIKEDYKKIVSFYKNKKVIATVLGLVIIICLIFAWKELIILSVIIYLIRVWVKSEKNKNNGNIKKYCPHCKEEVKDGATRCSHCQGKIPHWTIFKKAIAGLFGLIIISIIIASGSDSKPKEITSIPASNVQNYVFDIPSLIGKNLSEIKIILGTSETSIEPTQFQIDNGVDIWEKVWKKNGYSVMATYNIKTKEIIDLFLSSDNIFTNTTDILKTGNLSLDNSKYSVEFVKSLNKNIPGYTGAIIKVK